MLTVGVPTSTELITRFGGSGREGRKELIVSCGLRPGEGQEEEGGYCKERTDVESEGEDNGENEDDDEDDGTS